MDQTDEFQMKPLTPGLGFHKRPVTLKEHVAKTQISTQNVRRNLPVAPPEELISDNVKRTSREIINEIHSALKQRESQAPKSAPTSVKLSEILPRDVNDVPKKPLVPDHGPIENINFQIPDKAMSEQSGVKRGAHNNPPPSLLPVSVSFGSMILDAAIVLAVALLFVVSLIVVTKVDLLSVLRSSQAEFTTQLSLIVLYVSVYEMYVIIFRSFFGWTLGEWTFDLQMGSDSQIAQSRYPLLVLWRNVLALLTGIIFLPLFSLVLNKDISAKFTGLQLYKRNT